MKIHLMPQRSNEWFEIRKLKLTASHAQEIATADKGLDTYVNKLVAEFLATKEDDRYNNVDMERGKQLEDEAINIYQLETGNIVEKVGFIETDGAGCSPDGLINPHGGCEVKCHDNATYMRLIRTRKIESKYLWQCHMNLFITKRDWWDYIGYNPNYRQSICVIRIMPDEKKMEAIKTGIDKGTALIKQYYNEAEVFFETK